MRRCIAAGARRRLAPVALSLACLLALGGCLYGDPRHGRYGYAYEPDRHSHHRPHYRSHHHHDRGAHRKHYDAPRSFKPVPPVGRSLRSSPGRFGRSR